MAIAIRTATAADLPRIVEIYNQAVADGSTADLDPVTLDSRRGWFAAHDPLVYPILVATRDDVVGWLSFGAHRPGRAAVRRVAEISYYIDREHRRSGIGSALIDEALGRGRHLGYRALFAIVLEDNDASVALLERFGFERWGLLPDVAELRDRTTGQLYYGRSIGRGESEVGSS